MSFWLVTVEHKGIPEHAAWTTEELALQDAWQAVTDEIDDDHDLEFVVEVLSLGENVGRYEAIDCFNDRQIDVHIRIEELEVADARAQPVLLAAP
jgi:hypothetical protein